MRAGGHRARKSWRVGTRKAADYLIMARIRDQALSSLITTFPTITGMSSGEAREPHVTLFGPFRSRVRGDVHFNPDPGCLCRPEQALLHYR